MIPLTWVTWLVGEMKTKYQTKQKQVKERKLKRKKKKCCYRQTGRTDEHGNVGILSKKGCWKAKMSNKNLLKSDLLFWDAPLINNKNKDKKNKNLLKSNLLFWDAPLGRVRLLNCYQEVYVTGKTTNLIWFQCFWKFNWRHLHIILVLQCSPDQGNRWTPDNWDIWKGGRKTQKTSDCNLCWIPPMLSNLSRRPTKKSSYRASLSATRNFLLVFLEHTFVVNVCWISNHNVSSPINKNYDIQASLNYTLTAPTIPQMQLNLSPSKPRNGAGL